jgi:hypothetical protein
MGAYGPEEYGRLVAPAAKGSPGAAALPRLVAALPAALVNSLLVLFSRAAGKRGRIPLYNLRNSRHCPRFLRGGRGA